MKISFMYSTGMALYFIFPHVREVREVWDIQDSEIKTFIVGVNLELSGKGTLLKGIDNKTYL